MRRMCGAILLKTRCAQAGETVALERARPGQELFFGQLVEAAGVLDRDTAATDGGNHGSFAPDNPSICVRGGKWFWERVVAL
jgi:hypothetical protein